MDNRCNNLNKIKYAHANKIADFFTNSVQKRDSSEENYLR